MRLVRLRGDIIINIDRLDGIMEDILTGHTMVYVGGSKSAFFVDMPVDEVVDKIKEVDNEKASIC